MLKVQVMQFYFSKNVSQVNHNTKKALSYESYYDVYSLLIFLILTILYHVILWRIKTPYLFYY